MDPIKKYGLITYALLLATFTLTSLFNIFSPFQIFDNLIMRWFTSIFFTLFFGFIFSFILLFALENDVERSFRELSNKYNAKVSKNGRAVDFIMKNEKIRWSYTGPKMMRFYFRVKYTTKRKLDFRYNYGLLSIDPGLYRTKDEEKQRKKEIKTWRKGLKKMGYELNKVKQQDDTITFWTITKNTDLEKVMMIKETMPYLEE